MTATDNYDGDLTAAIVTVNPVDTSVLETYTVTYNVSDSSGNAAGEVTRTVEVIDTLTDPREEVDTDWSLYDASVLEDDYEKSDYTWSSAAVAEIELEGDSIVENTAGASVDGSVLTITSSGTYRISGVLSNGRIRVDTDSDDEGVVRLVLNGVDVTLQLLLTVLCGQCGKNGHSSCRRLQQ